MTKTLTTLSLRKYPNSTIAKYGLVGGFVAVIIMTVFILAMDVMIRLPADAFFAMVGLAMNMPVNQASLMGALIHITTGTVFGALTGVVANSIPYFRNWFIGEGTGRAVGLGVLSGTALFALLFAPLLTILMPPAMMSLLSSMKPNASQSDVTALARSLLPVFLAGGLALHWLYGGILGTVRGKLLPR